MKSYKHKQSGEVVIPTPGSDYDKRLAASSDYEVVGAKAAAKQPTPEHQAPAEPSTSTAKPKSKPQGS